MSPSRLEMLRRASSAGVWNKESGISYDEHCRLALEQALAQGYTDPANLRRILIATTNMKTAPTANRYLEQHRADPELLKALIAIALEGEDAGDGPWTAAYTIAEYPGAMLVPYKTELQAIAQEEWSNLHVPARKALGKIAAAEGG